jgi:hypothetical protein
MNHNCVDVFKERLQKEKELVEKIRSEGVKK